ncbi:TlpA family protein disulfide reductase [Nonomuraea sp. K274]|uniref:TlpA family protein disulfide reductase n=1 Tax=Nonomuraea cypriaca TaxID=1187855 RepID=A0A931F0M6_9ACTN|nr:TlpA disulfide reductase family protein [Nonomuraea cypriaca]MBF8191044.1 TlpA family protein disulfide reductase [Nonomuraea cypriaca]
MQLVVVALVLVAGLSVLNLVLTLAVIRRLRVHEELIGGERPALEPVMLPVGETPGEFVAEDVDGEKLSRSDLAAGLVGFFSTTCPACVQRLPKFTDLAAEHTDVIAVVVGEPGETTEMINTLRPVARVFTERHGESLTTAFAVHGYPATCRIDDAGTVLAHSVELG